MAVDGGEAAPVEGLGEVEIAEPAVVEGEELADVVEGIFAGDHEDGGLRREAEGNGGGPAGGADGAEGDVVEN